MSDSGDLAEYILQLSKQASKAARELAAVNGEARAAALSAMADALQYARGPVGPSELTSYKWIAYGDLHPLAHRQRGCFLLACPFRGGHSFHAPSGKI